MCSLACLCYLLCSILSNERAGDIVTSCLLNTSLVTALGIQDQFNFTEKIKFPKLPPIEQVRVKLIVALRLSCAWQTFNFSELFALDRSVQALTFSTFGYNSSFTDQQLQQLVSPDRSLKWRLCRSVADLVDACACVRPQSEVTAPEDNPDIIWTRANVRTCDVRSLRSAS